ncbi:type 1 glutamine amidotransferase domain-containing protein [Corynebacterium aquilae]|uniref:Transcriptional regulator n=1 Tax=Corynebacterium aquilae DSM 44791 TaxID=1431546 RepID=A0A1L7CHS1_9CORY|nr:type 1 glutamine amidotransferase domain-containing protein [Corynebacterium aquilae]APT85402.1 transcriptional regulator [Corynebacterium aquilae DSM 44791]
MVAQDTAQRSVLFVASAADKLTLKDGSTRPTGVWAEELAVPHRVFRDAGFDITIATPGGVAPTIDQFSLSMAGGLPGKRAKIRSYLDSIAEQLDNPVPLSEVDQADFDVVFYPGGHGPMEDLAEDLDSGQLLVKRLASGKPLGMLCHAPAAMLSAKTPHGSNAFAGRKITALSNKEELLNPFSLKLIWFLEDRLKQIGVSYQAGFPLRPHIVVDGNLYTGQNPQSSERLARAIVADLASS